MVRLSSFHIQLLTPWSKAMSVLSLEFKEHEGSCRILLKAGHTSIVAEWGCSRRFVEPSWSCIRPLLSWSSWLKELLEDTALVTRPLPIQKFWSCEMKRLKAERVRSLGWAISTDWCKFALEISQVGNAKQHLCKSKHLSLQASTA